MRKISRSLRAGAMYRAALGSMFLCFLKYFKGKEIARLSHVVKM